MLAQSVSNTLIRAEYLSLAETRVHGAISVLVRSTMSHTARSYASHWFRLRQSSSVILNRLNPVCARSG